MAVPDKARLMLFVPRATEALFCTTYYANELAQTDVRYQIKDIDGTEIVNALFGSAVTSFTVTGLALTVGTPYSGRTKHVNADGESRWSQPFVARVYDVNVGSRTAVAVPALPGDNPVTLTLQPSYRQAVRLTRGLIEQETESGAHLRRLPDRAETRRAKLVWAALTTTQKNTTLGELQDAADQARAFQTPPPLSLELGGELWLVQDGRTEARLTAPGLWEITAEALEVSP